LRYSIRTPRGNSAKWTILDNRGVAVFTGHYRQCEEWLDLCDAESRHLPKRSADYTIAFARMMASVGVCFHQMIGD
jgi:mannose/cellobiose epimerase-like protein (N-acyl-D-glucosamine 2-epimerase family)